METATTAGDIVKIDCAIDNGESWISVDNCGIDELGLLTITVEDNAFGAHAAVCLDGQRLDGLIQTLLDFAARHKGALVEDYEAGL